MFNRRLSQKPTDAFFRKFKDNFKHITSTAPQDSTAPAATTGPTTEGLLNTATRDIETPGVKDGTLTPRVSGDSWGFDSTTLTPSVMDPNSNSFDLYANQPPNYYTPTPGGNNTLHFHSQAGDLRTPGFSMGLNTPLSLPTSESAMQARDAAAAMAAAGGFSGYPNIDHQEHANHFTAMDAYQLHQPPTSFPPHHFTTQPPFSPMPGNVVESPADDMGLDINLSQSHHQQHGSPLLFHPPALQQNLHALQESDHGERSVDRFIVDNDEAMADASSFRYHTTLNAPTAMIVDSDEIPITYLNKGQAYTIQVKDTQLPTHHGLHGLQYRTFVRISFEAEEQRQRPASFWQLWKEGRGSNEAHQRGGRLQAVEYVDSNQTGSSDDLARPHLQLESASFDGFCVLWSPTIGAAAAECPISVRFNFLSTDFSHSKGVKGIPVRLCCKTELVGEGEGEGEGAVVGPEVCYCKVKLFRDHGAERKLSNDVLHIKKQIDKVDTQIAQLEAGQSSTGKRKRGPSFVSRSTIDGRPSKLARHSRTWSTPSSMMQPNSTVRMTAEEELQMRRLELNKMFTSTRTASILNLRGDPEDDPDLFPVKMSGVPAMPERMESDETVGWDSIQTGHSSSSHHSPSQSPATELDRDRTPTDQRHNQTYTQPGIEGAAPRRISSVAQPSNLDPSLPQFSPRESSASILREQPHLDDRNTTTSSSSPQKIILQPHSPTTGNPSKTNSVEVQDIDKTYHPPQSPRTKPKAIASFYVQLRITGRPVQETDSFYRAIYLNHRTASAFVRAAATKCQIDPLSVQRVIRITKKGLHVLFDDECVAEMPEAQDLVAEFCEYQPETPSRARNKGRTTLNNQGSLTVGGGGGVGGMAPLPEGLVEVPVLRQSSLDSVSASASASASVSVSASASASALGGTAYELRLMY